MSIARIKKNDIVIVTAGTESGKTGKVLGLLPAKNRAIVEGLKMVKKTLRKSQANPQGGIVEREGSVHCTNLMLYCPTCKKGIRVMRGKEADKRVRKCRACSHSFDS